MTTKLSGARPHDSLERESRVRRVAVPADTGRRTTPPRVPGPRRHGPWCFVVAAVLGLAVASVARSSPPQECVGQILKVLKTDIEMTVLQDGAGAGAGERKKIKKDGRTMKMPLCVLHYDDKKRRYGIRLPDGTEVEIIRRYVLEASDNPPITVNCDGYTVYLAHQEGGTRGSGEHPCD